MLKQVVSGVCGGVLLAQSAFAADLSVARGKMSPAERVQNDTCLVVTANSLASAIAVQNATEASVFTFLGVAGGKGLLPAKDLEENTGYWRKAVLAVSGAEPVVRAYENIIKTATPEKIESRCASTNADVREAFVSDVSEKKEVLDKALEDSRHLMVLCSMMTDVVDNKFPSSSLFEQLHLTRTLAEVADLSSSATTIVYGLQPKDGTVAGGNAKVYEGAKALCDLFDNPRVIENCLDKTKRDAALAELRSAAKVVVEAWTTAHPKDREVTMRGVAARVSRLEGMK